MLDLLVKAKLVTSGPRRGDVLLGSTDCRVTIAEIRLETP